MFRSLHMKLTLIMLLLVTSLMTVAGVFLTTSVSSFYINAFYQRMDDVFGSGREDVLDSLRQAAGEAEGAQLMCEILDANAGFLGVDNSSRNYFLLDGETCAYLGGSAPGSELPPQQSANLLTARTAVAAGDETLVGDESSIADPYMDVAIPVMNGEHSYIVYLLDNKANVAELNQRLTELIVQALLIGLVISILLSFLLSKAMVGPIETLTSGAERVAAGDFGEDLPVQSADEIGVLTGTFNEMSQVLRSTIAAVENERDKLDTLFLHMTDGVIAFDRVGRILHSNPAAVRLLSRELGEDCFYDDLFGDLRPFREMAALERQERATASLDLSGRALELYFASFADRTRRSGGVLVVIHDVTEQHHIEEQRKEFVANVSHELRTPLTNVRSYAETLLDANGEIPTPTANSFLEIIIKETDRMTNIVQDLLTLSRLDSGVADLTLSRFPFDEAIDSVVQANRISAELRGLSIRAELPETMPLVEADRARIEQVMTNIVSNAIKYTPEG